MKGFFLSMWTDGGIRFSYFTDDAERSSRGLNERLPRLGVVRYMDDEFPVTTALEYYTSETRTNLMFRRFLQLMTNVGLDLLDYDVSYARRLAAKYRLDIGPSGESSRRYFEKRFKRAAVYRTLDSSLCTAPGFLDTSGGCQGMAPTTIVDPDATVRSRFTGDHTSAAARAPDGV